MLEKTDAYLQFIDQADAMSTGETGLRGNGLLAAAKAEVKALRTLPPIMCLCGSGRFKEEILAAAEAYTMQGHIVLAPNVFTRESGDAGDKPGLYVTEEQKDLLDAIHFRKIDLAIRVHVVNTGGYIGESVHKEVNYAVRTDKLVTFQEPTVIPWDTRRRDSIQTAHYLEGIRDRVQYELGG